MMETGRIRELGLSVVACLAAGCASTGVMVEKPGVSLSNVEVTEIDLDSQTFVLDFDVSNPNPFPLPVKAVDYQVRFDDRKFAGGKTQGKFTVPAHGNDSFAISVELDILSSTSHLKSLMSGEFRENLSYELSGNFAVDIPLVKPISFSNSGIINMTQTASDDFD